MNTLNMNLVTVVTTVIRRSNLELVILLLLGVIAISGYVQYQISSRMASLLTGTTITEDFLATLVFWKISAHVLETVIGFIRRLKIRLVLQKTASAYLWGLVKNASPIWKENNENFHKGVVDGINCVARTVDLGMRLLKPILLIGSEIGVIFNVMGIHGFLVVLVILVIKFLGLQILKYDWASRKTIKKQISDKKSNSENSAENFLVHSLNGRGTQTKEMLVEIHSETHDLEDTHDFRVSFCIYMLEITEVLLISGVLWYSFRAFDEKFYTVIFMTVQNSCNYTWWVFHSVNSFLITIADWGTTEKLFDDYVEMVKKPTRILKPTDVLHVFSKVKEVRINGESGQGKSTWVRRKVISLYMKFMVGQWLYLKQKMALPKTDRTILEVMGDYLPSNVIPNVKMLCSFAQDLGIGNIINKDTVNSKFDGPSLGEEKRVLTLRAFLPILMGHSNIKFIFADEITAGLDTKHFLQVRKLIQFMKQKYKIYFVTIDHHDFAPDMLLDVTKKVVEKKVTVPVPEPKPSLAMRLLTNVLSRSEPVKKKDKKTEVVVWIPAIEKEPLK